MREATVQVIRALDPIPGADRLELARVLGWQVVVKKGEFRAGQLCVLVEPDSVLPEGPAWSEFLRKTKFRVKPVRLRGVVSQGVVLPLTVLVQADAPGTYPAWAAELWMWGDELGLTPKARESIYSLVAGWAYAGDRRICEGLDVSAALGVRHYARPEAGGVIGGVSAGAYPPIPRTDEPNLQSVPWMLEHLRGRTWQATVKLDGTSGTFARVAEPFSTYHTGQLLVCSRTRSLRRPVSPGNAFWVVADRYGLAEKIPAGWAVRGEVVGPKIQGNPLGLVEPDLFVFDVTELATGQHLDALARKEWCAERGLKEVPRVGVLWQESGWLQSVPEVGRLGLLPQLHQALQQAAWVEALGLFGSLVQVGHYADYAELGSAAHRPLEGIVVRPLVETWVPVPDGPEAGKLLRLSFKVLNPRYVEREGED